MSTSITRSGHYQYRLNGELAPVEEFWHSEALDDGGTCISSGRRAGPLAIDVEAIEYAGRIQSFSAQWQQAQGRELCVDYTLHEQILRVIRREGDVTQQREVDCGAGHRLLFPLMRIYVGPIIERLIDGGGQGCVILPDIGVDAESAQLFEPRFSERRAEFVASEVLQDESGAHRHCRRCLYLGDQYEKEARFWIAEDHLLQRYQWRQDASRLWDVTLIRDD